MNTHYLYDHSGNLTNDAHKGMQFSYNFLNLPLSISTPLLLRSRLRASADAKGTLHPAGIRSSFSAHARAEVAAGAAGSPVSYVYFPLC